MRARRTSLAPTSTARAVAAAGVRVAGGAAADELAQSADGRGSVAVADVVGVLNFNADTAWQVRLD